jgi:molecular chaperone DnaJ
MSKRDYYEVLGLTKDATDVDIKKAFRKKAKEMHPDAGGDKELFQELNEANEVLSDPDRKASYDQFGHTGPQRQTHNPFADFFRNHNPFTPQRLRGENMGLVIKLTLEEIFTGVTKKFKYKRNNKCATCSGKGGTGIKACTTCQGSGVSSQVFQTQFGTQVFNSTCNSCNGSGEMVETLCDTCHGTGLNEAEESISIDIPSGVADNMNMSMTGYGHFIKNGIAGDLIITIMELPHDKFVRNGNDLKYNLKLTYPQLILGGKVEVSTIEGSRIRIDVPEYTKTGAILRIPTKGLKQLQNDNRGDLLLYVELSVPTKISDEERELILAIKKINENVATESTK